MKQLTLTSKFFKNECAESFLKAIQGNLMDNGNTFCGYSKRGFEPFISNCDGDIVTHNSITFNLDDSFKVDWACLELIRGYTFPEDLREQHRLDLDYLSTLEGVEIKEA